ncbi:SPAC26H5.02c ATPase WRNIP1 C26H5.02c [Candida maltosa Xu316]
MTTTTTEVTCPICSKSFSNHNLERHVNSCLDNQGSTQPPPTDEHQSDTSLDNIEPKKRNALSALGLKFDSGSSQKKKKKPEIKRISLTSQLIEERRLQAEAKKEEEEDEVEDDEIQEIVNVPKESVPKESEVLRKSTSIPLAQRLRPKTLDDFVGQEKLLGENGVLRNMVESDILPSFLLWGPPGIGKTSLARIIGQSSSAKFVELSGTSSNSKQIKEVFEHAENHKNLTGQRTILFVDEIHRYNKAVQDLFLPVVEKGVLTIIGATTENPSFNLNNALLSRLHTFVMDPLTDEALIKILTRAMFEVNRVRKNLYGLKYISLQKDAYQHIGGLSMGDSRVALNMLEALNAYLSVDKFKEEDDVVNTQISAEMLQPLFKTRNFHQIYDKNGDAHYDLISAFHKSIRGSDPNAAMFYLVKMLSGGEDPFFILRRMIVIASEDIGLRDSSCLPFMVSAKQALEFVGMPEGEIILAHCVNKLALAPKSTKSYRSLRKAQNFIRENPDLLKLPVPVHLRNAPTRLMKELGYGHEYKYNPNYENGLVKQTYFPDGMGSVSFLEDTHLGTERDPLVPEEEYERAQDEVDDYGEFQYQFVKNLPAKYVGNRDQKDEYLREMYSQQQDNDESQGSTTVDDDLDKFDQYSDNFGKSFDENLEKDVQRDYFGEELTQGESSLSA